MMEWGTLQVLQHKWKVGSVFSLNVLIQFNGIILTELWAGDR